MTRYGSSSRLTLIPSRRRSATIFVYGNPLLTSLGCMRRVVKFGLVVVLSAPAALAQNSAGAVAGTEQGKAIFVSRCAKCHDADASRKLPDGTTLLGRLAEKQDRRAALATRLKSEQERDAVLLYLQPLIDHWHPAAQGHQASPSPGQPQQR